MVTTHRAGWYHYSEQASHQNASHLSPFSCQEPNWHYRQRQPLMKRLFQASEDCVLPQMHLLCFTLSYFVLPQIKNNSATRFLTCCIRSDAVIYCLSFCPLFLLLTVFLSLRTSFWLSISLSLFVSLSLFASLFPWNDGHAERTDTPQGSSPLTAPSRATILQAADSKDS